MTHLVALSGGPDSTWCLQHVLKTTTDPVIALHVSLVDRSRRWERELMSVRQIQRHLIKHVRHFQVQEATMNPPESKSYIDWSIIGAYIGMVLRARDDITDVWGGTGHHDGVVGPRDEMGRKIALLIAQQENDALAGGKEPLFHYEPAHLDKRAIRLELGEELWNKTWSCRRPFHGIPCGKCMSCEKRKLANG